MSAAGDAPTPALVPILAHSGALLLSALTGLASLTYHAVLLALHGIRAAARPLPALLRAALRPAHFVLAPLLFLLRVLYDVTLGLPLGVAARVGGELRGVWVFVGAALVVGCVVGVAARGVATILVKLVLRLQRSSGAEAKRQQALARRRTERERLRRGGGESERTPGASGSRAASGSGSMATSSRRASRKVDWRRV